MTSVVAEIGKPTSLRAATEAWQSVGSRKNLGDCRVADALRNDERLNLLKELVGCAVRTTSIDGDPVGCVMVRAAHPTVCCGSIDGDSVGCVLVRAAHPTVRCWRRVLR